MLLRAAEASRAVRGAQVNMNSVERLVEYAGFAPEAPPVVPGRRPPPRLAPRRGNTGQGPGAAVQPHLGPCPAGPQLLRGPTAEGARRLGQAGLGFVVQDLVGWTWGSLADPWHLPDL